MKASHFHLYSLKITTAESITMLFKTPEGDIEYHIEINEFLIRLLNDNDLRVVLSLLECFKCSTFYLKELATMVNITPTRMAICLKKLTETGLIICTQHKPPNSMLMQISFSLSQKYFDDYIALDRLYKFNDDLTEEMYYRAKNINKIVGDEYKISKKVVEYLKERGKINEI